MASGDKMLTVNDSLLLELRNMISIYVLWASLVIDKSHRNFSVTKFMRSSKVIPLNIYNGPSWLYCYSFIENYHMKSRLK